jgi:hypothetical protein
MGTACFFQEAKPGHFNACRSGPAQSSGRYLTTTTARQRLRRGACPLTVRLYGKGAQQSIKRCVAASKRFGNKELGF